MIQMDYTFRGDMILGGAKETLLDKLCDGFNSNTKDVVIKSSIKDCYELFTVELESGVELDCEISFDTSNKEWECTVWWMNNEKRGIGMDRLKIIEKLQKLETRKRIFESLKRDTTDAYTSEVSITANIRTRMFEDRREYKGEQVIINQELFKIYIDKELEVIEKTITALIDDLRGGNS